MFISVSQLLNVDDADILEDVREETLPQSLVQDLKVSNDNHNDGDGDVETGLFMPHNIQDNTVVAAMKINEAQLEFFMQLQHLLPLLLLVLKRQTVQGLRQSNIDTFFPNKLCSSTMENSAVWKNLLSTDAFPSAMNYCSSFLN